MASGRYSATAHQTDYDFQRAYAILLGEDLKVDCRELLAWAQAQQPQLNLYWPMKQVCTMSKQPWGFLEAFKAKRAWTLPAAAALPEKD